MKRSKFQLMKRLSTILAIGMLVLQVVTPIGVAFATEIDSGTAGAMYAQEPAVPAEGTAPAEEFNSSKVELPDGLNTVNSVDTSTAEKPAGEAENGQSEEEPSEEPAEDPEPASSDEPTPVVSGKDLGRIFKGLALSVNGAKVADSSIIAVDESTVAELKLDWQAVSAQAGDWAELQLPAVFRAVDTTTAQPVVVGGVNVGEYTITNGVLKLVLNDSFASSPANENDWLKLNLNFNLGLFQQDITQKVSLYEPMSEDLTVTVKPRGELKAITQSGAADSTVNPAEINWSVDVINTTDTVTDGKVTNKLPAGLGTAAGFIVEKIKVGVNGDISVVETVNAAPTANDQTVAFNFNGVQPYQGYRIQFKTPVEKFNASFKNAATFDYGINSTSAEATVEGLTNNEPAGEEKTEASSSEDDGEPALESSEKATSTKETKSSEESTEKVASTETTKSEESTEKAASTEATKSEETTEKAASTETTKSEESTEKTTSTEATKSEESTEAGTKISAGDSEEKSDSPFKGVSNFFKGLFGVGPQAELSGIFKEMKLFKGDGQGGDVEVNPGEKLEIDAQTWVNLYLDWSTKGLKPQAGDTARLKLPEIFKAVDLATPREIPVTDPDTGAVTVVGEYTIKDGELIFTFNENISNGSNVDHGWLKLGFQFDLEKVKSDVPNEIKINDDAGGSLIITPTKPTSGTKKITKSGMADNNYNPTKITWTVEVVNTSKDVVENGTLEDFLPVGLKAAKITGAQKIKATDDAWGSTEDVGAPLDATKLTLTKNDDTGFKMNLPTMQPGEGYRLVFETPIDKFGESFKNTARFDDGVNPINAGSTVSGLTAGGSIEKSGEYDPETNEVTWTIDVNKEGHEFNQDVRIEDVLSNGLRAKDIQAVKITKANGSWTPDSSDTPKSFTQFPVNLGKLGSDDVYRITFKTVVPGNVKGATLKNTANLVSGNIKTPATTEVPTQGDPLLTKGVIGIDAYNKKIKWRITVNKDKQQLKNTIITDRLPKGLELKKEDITIRNSKWQTISTDNVTLSGTPAAGMKAEIALPDGDETYTIEYTTTIVDSSITSFENTAGITGDGIGPGTNEVKDKAIVTMPDNLYSKAPGRNDPALTEEQNKAHVNYERQTISWHAATDTRGETFTELEIVDTFPDKGLTLVEDTVKVVFFDKVTNQMETLTKDKNYTIVNNGEDGFTVRFKDADDKKISDLNGIIRVMYDTAYDLTKITNTWYKQNGMFRNTARFVGKTTSGKDISVPAPSYKTIDRSIVHSGKKNGRKIHYTDTGEKARGWDWGEGITKGLEWEVYVNATKQTIAQDLVIMDELSYKGEFNLDSVKIYSYTMDATGKTTINTNDELAKAKYSAALVDGKLQVTLKGSEAAPINERYVLVYDTTVPENFVGTYRNTATVENADHPLQLIAEVSGESANGSYISKKAKNVKEPEHDDNGNIVSGATVHVGQEVDWEVAVNESADVISGASITDIMHSDLEFVEGSLEIVEVTTNNQERKLSGEEKAVIGDAASPGVDYKYHFVSKDNALQIKMVNDVTNKLLIRYKTKVKEIKSVSQQVNNRIVIKGTGLDDVFEDSTFLTASKEYDVGGVWGADLGVIEAKKVDGTGAAITNNVAEFKLWLNAQKTEAYTVNGTDVFTTDAKGVLTIANLPLGTYYLEEVTAPVGYILDSQLKEITVKAYRDNEANISKVTIENQKLLDVTASKVWVNGPEERPTVWFQLFRHVKGSEPTAVSDAEIKELKNGTTEVTWEGLPKTDADGNDYVYTVEEVDAEGNDFVPKGYFKNKYGLTIVNTHIPRYTDISAKKVWVGGPAEKPTVWFQLFRHIAGEEPVAVDEEDVDIKELSDGTTEVTWEFMSELDPKDNEYIYTVKEVDADGKAFTPEGYTKSEKGLTVTNTYEAPKEDITATKVWQDGPTVKPTVWFQLFRHIEGGTPAAVADAEIKELKNGATEVTWEELATTDASGNDYIYTVKEVDADGNDFTPAGYTKSEKDLTVTNTFNVAEKDITATKVWEDGPTVKPTVWFKLFRSVNNETPVEVKDADILELAEGTTEVTWKDLPETDLNGNEYTYSVKEVNADGEDFAPADYEKAENGLTVTNSYVSPKDASARATKIWVDGPAAKPTVWFQLYRHVEGGTPETFEDAEIKELKNGTTEVVWTGLAKTDASGKEYIYSVKEVDAEGKDFTPEGYTKDEKDLTVTNTFAISETEISVEKVWEGGKSEPIEVQLTRNGEDFGDPVTLTGEQDKWAHTWEKLAATDKVGEAFEYGVKEVDVPKDFTSKVESSEDGKDFTITNTYTPKKVSVGDYVWIDVNKDGLQDDTDIPVEGVELILVDEKGEPVTDIHGNIVKPTKTDEKGYYIFKDLPADHEYTVKINQENLPEILKDHVPTKPGAGDDRAKDSSTWEATSEHLTKDGQHDPTLDFGFTPTTKETTEETSSTTDSSSTTETSSTTDSSSTTETSSTTDSSSTTETSSTTDSSSTTETSSTTDSSSTTETSSTTDSSKPKDSSCSKDSSEPKDSSSTTDSSKPKDTSCSKDSSEPKDSSSTTDSSKPKDTSSTTDSSKPKDSSCSKDSSEPKDSSSTTDSSKPKDTSCSKDSSEPKDSSSSSDSSEPKDTSSSSDSSEPKDTSSSSDSSEPKDTSSSSDSSEPKDSSSSSDSSEPKDTSSSSDSSEPKDSSSSKDSSEPKDSSSSSDSSEPKDSSSSSDSSEPKDSSSSKDSSEPKDSSGSKDSSEPKDNGGKTDKDGKLPQTGSESTLWVQILGLVMVAFAGIGYASYTRKQRKH